MLLIEIIIHSCFTKNLEKDNDYQVEITKFDLWLQSKRKSRKNELFAMS